MQLGFNFFYLFVTFLKLVTYNNLNTLKKRRKIDETAQNHKAQVFKKYGLDFCCGGKKTVKEACAEKGIDVTKVEQELQSADKNNFTSRPIPYNEWSLDFLADYIVNTHHPSGGSAS